MSGEAERDAVKVKLAISDGFANEYIKDRPEGQVNLTIYRFERDDDTHQFEWSGRLTSHEVNGGEVALRFEPDSTGLAATMLPRIAMRQCPHTQYVGECRLNREVWRHVVPLISLDGSTVTVSLSGAFDYAGGIIEASNGDTRGIKAQSGGVLTLVRPLPALALDTEVSLFPSCLRSPTRCRETFGNIDNYGGFQWMLTGDTNPFAGSSVI